MKFFLGTCHPNWIGFARVPWFISVTALRGRKSRVPEGEWIMDSGGFTQIAMHGKYMMTPEDYVDAIFRQIPVHAFCQDWMVEKFILEKTGLTIRDHQGLTLENYLLLDKLGRGLPIRPVLQGWKAEDYVRHLRDYRKAGVRLDQLFGLGTVCSRNGNLGEVEWILKAIHDEAPGIQIHGFGLKTTAFTSAHIVERLASADSMAWSSRGRRQKLCGDLCGRGHKSCGNCLEWALLWRRRVLGMVNRREKQLFLPVHEAQEVRG
jgi:hypothetical protein